jgi:hypothetical protein
MTLNLVRMRHVVVRLGAACLPLATPAKGRLSAQEPQPERSESNPAPGTRVHKAASRQSEAAGQAWSFQELRAETAIRAIRIDRAQRAL